MLREGAFADLVLFDPEAVGGPQLADVPGLGARGAEPDPLWSLEVHPHETGSSIFTKRGGLVS